MKKNKYLGITHEVPYIDLLKWQRYKCPQGVHALDEVWSPDCHYLVCDACNLKIDIKDPEVTKPVPVAEEIKFRTFKVLDLNNDIMGRVMVGTRAPHSLRSEDLDGKVLEVAFAFCSLKDNFDRNIGKSIIKDKLDIQGDVFYFEIYPGDKVSDILREIILDVAQDRSILWMKGIGPADLV